MIRVGGERAQLHEAKEELRMLQARLGKFLAASRRLKMTRFLPLAHSKLDRAAFSVPVDT